MMGCFKRLGSVSALLLGATLLTGTAGCKPVVEGASAGIMAAAEYLITTPLTQWIDESLADSNME